MGNSRSTDEESVATDLPPGDITFEQAVLELEYPELRPEASARASARSA